MLLTRLSVILAQLPSVQQLFTSFATHLTLLSVSNLACRIFYLVFLNARRTLAHFHSFIAIIFAFLLNFRVCHLNEIT